MRTEGGTAKVESRNRLVVSVMALALASGALLSIGAARTAHATPSGRATRPAAAVSASTMADRISPGEAIADREVLDLQLD